MKIFTNEYMTHLALVELIQSNTGVLVTLLFSATAILSPYLIKQEKTSLAFAVCVLMLSVVSSFGQYASVIHACTQDVMKSCAHGQQADPLAECVKLHFEDFSEPCKAALVSIVAVRDACGAAIQKQCPAIKPGAGRILLCVKQHFAALSESCKDAIGHSAERKARAH